MSSELKAAVKWLALAGVVWAGAVGLQRLRPRETPPPAALPSWQQRITSRPAESQAAWRRVRDGIVAMERERGKSGAWPEPAEAFFPGWTKRQQRLVVNYLGEAAGERWLVLFLEPEPPRPGVPAEPPAPEDEEHHTLADGTALHVTVWTQPLNEPPPDVVLAFPANEGWTQLVEVPSLQPATPGKGSP